MSNHFHILLELPPMPEGGISDAELLGRLAACSGDAFVAGVGKDLFDARKAGDAERIAEIHARFTYRMHNLSEFISKIPDKKKRILAGWDFAR